MKSFCIESNVLNWEQDQKVHSSVLTKFRRLLFHWQECTASFTAVRQDRRLAIRSHTPSTCTAFSTSWLRCKCFYILKDEFACWLPYVTYFSYYLHIYATDSIKGELTYDILGTSCTPGTLAAAIFLGHPATTWSSSQCMSSQEETARACSTINTWDSLWQEGQGESPVWPLKAEWEMTCHVDCVSLFLFLLFTPLPLCFRG